MATLEQVLRDIAAERAYQDRLWGGSANDDTQAEADWQRYIAEYSAGTGRAAGRPFRERMIKVAALAAAAAQAHDRRAAAALVAPPGPGPVPLTGGRLAVAEDSPAPTAAEVLERLRSGG